MTFLRHMPMAAASIALFLAMSGCTQKIEEGWVGFVVNQDSKADQTQGPGKSYTAKLATLKSSPQSVELDAFSQATSVDKVKILVPTGGALDGQVGKTLPVESGVLVIDKTTYTLSGGNFTLQSLSGGNARGNFSARVKDHNPPWEVVGCFVTAIP